MTVSSFLKAGLLDRLHIAVAPLLIGEGRPAIRLPPQAAPAGLSAPAASRLSRGIDILFDCDLRAAANGTANGHDPCSSTPCVGSGACCSLQDP